MTAPGSPSAGWIDVVRSELTRLGGRRTDIPGSCWTTAQTFFLTVPLMALEFYMGVLTMTYGVWLLMPWHGYATSPMLGTLQQVIPNENVLGLIFLVPGTCQAWLAFWPSAARWPRVRFVTAIALCVLWAMMIAGFVLVDWRSRGVALMGVQLLTQVWITARVGRQPRARR